MIKKVINLLLTKLYHSPTCNCGWVMKPMKKYNRPEWKCIWRQCNWETFQDQHGRLHWWTH